MKKIITFAIAGLVLAASFQARALIIVAPQTVTFTGVSDGVPQPNDQLLITYEVNEVCSGLYEYSYDLKTVVPQPLTSFTIGGAADPLDTEGLAMLDYGKSDVFASGFDCDSVGWDWGFRPKVTSDDVSFTSPIAPGCAAFTVNDDDIEWSSPALLAAPVAANPVPEPAAFSFLVASVFAFCLLKDRVGIKK